MKKTYTDAFKVKIALEAVKKKRSLEEISQIYKVAQDLIILWKDTLLKNAHKIFNGDLNKEISPLPFIVYYDGLKYGCRLMGSDNGKSLKINAACCQADSLNSIMKIKKSEAETWIGMQLFAYENLNPENGKQSLDLSLASKLRFTMKASKKICINEIGFGSKNDSAYIRAFNIAVGKKYISYEIDLTRKNLSDINGLFYFFIGNPSSFDLFIKEIIIV